VKNIAQQSIQQIALNVVHAKSDGRRCTDVVYADTTRQSELNTAPNAKAKIGITISFCKRR